MYVPKKEVPVAPMEVIKQTSITIVSKEVPLNEVDESIVAENLVQSSMQKVKARVAPNKDKAESSKLNSKYFQPKFDQDAMVQASTCSL
jgi:hypothetical protein